MVAVRGVCGRAQRACSGESRAGKTRKEVCGED